MAKSGLIISYYFPPTGGGGVQRWLKFVKYLSSFGWDLTVITNDHPPNAPRDESLLKEVPQNIEIIRIPNPPASRFLIQKLRYIYKSGYWQRWLSAFFYITDRQKSWNQKVRKIVDQKLKKKLFEAIIFTVPPYSLALLAAELTDRVTVPIYLDLRDPWTLNPYKIYPTIIHRLIDRYREKTSVKKIKNIISAYQATLTEYGQSIEQFSTKHTLFLPNGYDEYDFSTLQAEVPSTAGGFNIGFSGSIYSHLNRPDTLFLAIKNLISEGFDIHFHHVGTSVYDLKKQAKKIGIEENIHLWGYHSHFGCLEILKRMDALCLLLDGRYRNAENTIGGKFYEYLRLKKPIFAMVPETGEAASVIRKTNSGLIVSGSDIEAIVISLRKLITSDIKFSWENLEEYNRKNQAQTLHEYLTQLTPDPDADGKSKK